MFSFFLVSSSLFSGMFSGCFLVFWCFLFSKMFVLRCCGARVMHNTEAVKKIGECGPGGHASCREIKSIGRRF